MTAAPSPSTAPIAAVAPGADSPIGAKTIPLAKAPGSSGPGAVGRATTPLQAGGARPLPQATVKMTQTQPLGTPGAPTKSIPKAAPNIQSTAVEDEEEWEEDQEEPGLMPFAIIVLILALAVLAIELFTKMGAGS